MFPFRSHVQVFLWDLSTVYRLKWPFNCFSSRFCFLVIVVLLIFVICVLFLHVVINLSLFFLIWSSSLCIDESKLSSMLVSSLPPPFLVTYSLSISSPGCKVLCIVINFYVLWTIYRSSSFVHLKYGLHNVTWRTSQVFIYLMRWILQYLASVCFLVRLKYHFLFRDFLWRTAPHPVS